MASYWLLDWIDEMGIESPRDVSRLLANPRAVDQFIELSEVRAERDDPVVPSGANTLVASGELDLFGTNCYHADCVRQRLDDILRRSWHYFDEIVVHGVDPGMSRPRGKKAFDEFRYEVEQYVESALYIRELGAESLLIFATGYPHYCMSHIELHAVEAGLTEPGPLIDALAAHLQKEGRLNTHKSKNKWRYEFRHPEIPTVTAGHVSYAEARSREDVLHYVTRGLAAREASHLAGDVKFARNCHAALGRAGGVPLDTDSAASVTAGSVAFNLVLPLPQNVPIRDLVAMRDDEYDAFESFRAALRAGIEQRIAALPNGDEVTVAESVLNDILLPSISKLDRQLNRASSLALRMSGSAVAIGGVTTTVGTLALAGLVVPGIAIGAGGILTALHNYFKDRKEVELSDMYFLWKASRLPSGGGHVPRVSAKSFMR